MNIWLLNDQLLHSCHCCTVVYTLINYIFTDFHFWVWKSIFISVWLLFEVHIRTFGLLISNQKFASSKFLIDVEFRVINSIIIIGIPPAKWPVCVCTLELELPDAANRFRFRFRFTNGLCYLVIEWWNQLTNHRRPRDVTSVSTSNL